MFTVFSKLWLIVSLGIMMFVGGMMYANSSGSSPYKIPSFQNLLPGQKATKSTANSGSIIESTTKSVVRKSSGRSLVSESAHTPYQAPQAKQKTVANVVAPAALPYSLYST